MQNYYQRNTYTFVNGLEGAKAYPMLPNQMVLLMDADSPVCYQKTSDAYGKSVLKCFKLVEVNETELTGATSSYQNEIENINKRIDDLYSLINKETPNA